MDRRALRNRLAVRLTDAEAVYRTGRSMEEIALLADIFADDLAGEDVETIDRAFLAHRRSNTRFPTPAHIIALLPLCRAPRELPPAMIRDTDGPRTPGLGVAAGRAIRRVIRGDAEARQELAEIFHSVAQAARV